MKIVRGDLWESGADLICVTVSGQTDLDNLIMGAGAALDAKMRYPNIASQAYKAILDCAESQRRQDAAFVFGFAVAPVGAVPDIGLFQTKYTIGQRADLALIGYSIVKLNLWLQRIDVSPNFRVALNFPGIGLGRLRRESVLPLLESLDRRVTIYER